MTVLKDLISTNPSLQFLSEDKIDAMIASWTLHITNEIPQNRIIESYKAAVKSHVGQFPLSVSEVIQAWKVIHGEERARATIKYHAECNSCEGAKTITIYDPLKKENLKITCPRCLGCSLNPDRKK